jgi:hypothetical protein
MTLSSDFAVASHALRLESTVINESDVRVDIANK